HEFFTEQTYPPRQIVESVMRELRRRADVDGVVRLPMAELARSISLKGDRQVYSSLRILEDYGLVRGLSGNGASLPRLRLIATPKRITRELDEGGRAQELHLLRRLWKMGGGEALYRGVEMDWRRLASLAGDRDRAVSLLDSLQGEGFLEWSRGAEGEGVQVLDTRTPLNRLPVDWRSVEARKNRELQKLRQMQGYAYEERCRRGYVLRYFGDPEAMDECGACDNCRRGEPIAAVQREPSQPRRRTRERAPAAPTFEPDAEVDAQLFEELRSLRSRLAREDGVPAYCVFSNRTLQALAARQPTTEDDLLDTPGVGPAKLEKYGEAFLQLLRDRVGA
ncbi:MAG TPA: HRDC domain-containing protein, partial [Longimicrobiaceae bacterium]|nr:HRDC domain-containing protein [Longimicrobiaceae bacterium]